MRFAREIWGSSSFSYRNVSPADLITEGATYESLLSFELIAPLDVEEATALARDCFALLDPGGSIILTSYFPRTRREAERAGLTNRFHLHLFTRMEIQNLLRDVGFEEITQLGNLLVRAKRPVLPSAPTTSGPR